MKRKKNERRRKRGREVLVSSSLVASSFELDEFGLRLTEYHTGTSVQSLLGQEHQRERRSVDLDGTGESGRIARNGDGFDVSCEDSIGRVSSSWSGCLTCPADLTNIEPGGRGKERQRENDKKTRRRKRGGEGKGKETKKSHIVHLQRRVSSKVSNVDLRRGSLGSSFGDSSDRDDSVVVRDADV